MKLAIDSFCLLYFPGTSPTFSQLMASFPAFTQWLPNSPTFLGFLGFEVNGHAEQYAVASLLIRFICDCSAVTSEVRLIYM